MASPTLAECETQLKNLVKIFDDFLTGGAATFLTNEDTYVQSLETNLPAEALDPIRAARAKVDEFLLGFVDAVTPIIREMGRLIDAPETDVRTIIQRRLYDYYIANTKTIKSRGITYGSISAGGSNVGNGTINRLTKDAQNLDIEATFLDIKTAKIVSDQSTGTNKHEEVFEFRGGARSLAPTISPLGSGLVTQIPCVSAASSLFLNPSWSDFEGTVTALTSLTNWTVASSLSNLNLDGTNYYRGFPGDTTPYALKFLANESISQLLSLGGRVIDPLVPMYCQIAYNRQVGAGDGTITLTVGSKSATVNLAAQTGWNILRLAIGQNNWYERFMENDLDITIALSSRTTGSVLIDDLIFVPYTNFDGLWYCPVGGSTPFLKDDYDTFTDALTGSDSKIQKWLWRGFSAYLPHTGSPSVTDPA